MTITLSSFTEDLKAAFISWTVDGHALVGGIGEDSITIKTKGLGASTTITALVTALGQAPVERTVTISPTSVDMLWEATDAVVPPLYRGKAMPTSESAVKFVAIPQVLSSNGAALSPDGFLYDWEENYVEDDSKDGYAKSGFDTAMDYLNPAKHMSVDVSGRDGAVVASNEMDVSPSDPELLFYASSPLYGPLYGNALNGSYTVNGSDTSVLAEPYFFSPGNTASPSLAYTWTLNGSPIDTPTIPNSLFLHRDSNSTGTATLSVEIANTTKLFQDLTANLALSLQ